MSVVRSGSFAAVLAAESRSEIRKATRLPAFLVPTLIFPAMFYVLFGVVLNEGNPLAALGGLRMPAYLLATYGTFGVVGAALFGLGIGVAAERGQGWLMLKRATPMPPLAYFLAKGVMSMLVGTAIVALLAILGAAFGAVRLGPASWLLLFATLVLGTIPFCALGCALGYISGPNSAPMLANLIYLPMSILSGLWFPIEFMPSFMQALAPALPPWHLAQLALMPIRGYTSAAPVHIAALGAWTLLCLAAAVLLYRRDDDRTWG